jgi:peptidoglycan L-alanyl-D-glutamate endopeptidase CwlK
MSRDLELLNKEFRKEVEILLLHCKEQHIKLVVYYSFRSVQEQARLWRQSRRIQVIENTIRLLEKQKAYYLAQVLEEVGPQNGEWRSDAPPGFSWHNFGFAIDSYVSVQTEKGEEAIWDSDHVGYEVYSTEAVRLGLTSGRYWKKQDCVHVQKPSKTVLEHFQSYVMIDQIQQRMNEK